MGLKRTKLLGIQAVTGINTVGILTVGVTPTAGGVGVASTTYLRGVVMHNTGLATATSSLYVYPNGVSDISVGQTAYRLARVDIASNETQHQLEEQVLVVLSTIKSLATQIFEVIRHGSKIITE
jgi:hypothetical protein